MVPNQIYLVVWLIHAVLRLYGLAQLINHHPVAEKTTQSIGNSTTVYKSLSGLQVWLQS